MCVDYFTNPPCPLLPKSKSATARTCFQNNQTLILAVNTSLPEKKLAADCPCFQSHAQNILLAMESPKGGVRVKCPVSPCRACKAVLVEHANDSHHCQPTIGQLSAEALRFELRVVCCQQRWFPFEVARCGTFVIPTGCLTNSTINQKLEPPQCRK